MNLEKYTERARGFVQSAQSLALREGHQQFTPEHILKVLLDDDQGLAAGLIDRAGGRSRDALAQTDLALAKLPKVQGSGAGQLYLAPTTARLFDNAEKIAQKAGDSAMSRSSACCSRSPWKRAATPAAFSPMPASPRSCSMPRSKICARAARPTIRRPKTPMTR